MSQPKILLAVIEDEKGEIQVQGPLENKVLCWGLLEAAKLKVASHVVKQSLVQPVAAIPPGLHVGNGR